MRVDFMFEDFGFVINFTNIEEHYVSFEVEEVVAYELGDKQNYESQLYLTGTIKWDSCSHFWFGERENGEQDGYLHICGVKSFEKHIKLLEFLYKKAFELMNRQPEKGEEWTLQIR
jgi:hypothetical protein